MEKNINSIDGFGAHDHGSCISGGIAAAERYCAQNGVQLTAGRKRVLEILLAEHRALGAYDILQHLGNAQPPVVYRALDFLMQHGFAHKIERLNAYVGCALPSMDHTPGFLICRDCNAVSETHADVSVAMSNAAAQSGFAIDRTIVEALGQCPNCQASA